MKKGKNSIYNLILKIREKVEQAKKVKTCSEQWNVQEERLSKVNRNELDL